MTLNVVPVTQVSYERVFIAQYTAPDIHLSPSSSRGSVGPASYPPLYTLSVNVCNLSLLGIVCNNDNVMFSIPRNIRCNLLVGRTKQPSKITTLAANFQPLDKVAIMLGVCGEAPSSGSTSPNRRLRCVLGRQRGICENQ